MSGSGSGENVRKFVVERKDTDSVDLSILEENTEMTEEFLYKKCSLDIHKLSIIEQKRSEIYDKLSRRWLGEVARPTEQFKRIESVIMYIYNRYKDLKFRYELIQHILKIEKLEVSEQQTEWDKLYETYSIESTKTVHS